MGFICHYSLLQVGLRLLIGRDWGFRFIMLLDHLWAKLRLLKGLLELMWHTGAILLPMQEVLGQTGVSWRAKGHLGLLL